MSVQRDLIQQFISSPYENSDYLLRAFTWQNTPQGYSYWLEIFLQAKDNVNFKLSSTAIQNLEELTNV
jgi:hypothetical protein